MGQPAHCLTRLASALLQGLLTDAQQHKLSFRAILHNKLHACVLVACGHMLYVETIKLHPCDSRSIARTAVRVSSDG